MEIESIRDELIRLAREDGDVRQRLAEDGSLFDGYNPLMALVHRRNGDRLEQIVDVVGWPGVRLVGEDGADAAWLLLKHAIGQPELQPGHSRMRGGNFRSEPQCPRRLDVDQQTDRPRDAAAPLRFLQRRCGRTYVGRRLRLRQIQQRDLLAGKCHQIPLEMRRAERVDAHDEGLHGVPGSARPQEIGHLLARVGFGVFRNGILHVKRDRIRGAGQRLGEQLGARAGYE